MRMDCIKYSSEYDHDEWNRQLEMRASYNHPQNYPLHIFEKDPSFLHECACNTCGIITWNKCRALRCKGSRSRSGKAMHCHDKIYMCQACQDYVGRSRRQHEKNQA